MDILGVNVGLFSFLTLFLFYYILIKILIWSFKPRKNNVVKEKEDESKSN